MAFPKIKNMRWVSEVTPELIVVKVLMENRVQAQMGVKDPEEQLLNFYLDLSKLAGVKPWIPKGQDVPSETECLCDFMGIEQVILNITIEQMLQAWTFYKEYNQQLK